MQTDSNLGVVNINELGWLTGQEPEIDPYAAFGSGGRYRKYKFPTRNYCSIHPPTGIYYSSTQHNDNSDFATLTFAMAAASQEKTNSFLFCSY